MINEGQGHRVRRMLAIVGTAALAVVGLAAGGGAAYADDPPSPADITGTSGSIVVHKHSNNPGAAGTGHEISDTSPLGPGIADIDFKIERVAYNGTPIDLGTVEGWSRVLDDMDVSDITGNYTLVPVSPPVVSPQRTNASGILTFSDLPLGLYVITELDTGPGSANVETEAAPFLVSVPHRGAADNTWNYNVHVYPKNELKDVTTKAVGDPTGNVVPWTITATVPRPAQGQTFSSNMTITDTLDSRLTYVSSTISKNGAAATAASPTVDGQLVTWTIPMADLVIGDTYVIVMQTTVTGPGEIPNQAYRNLDGKSVPTNTVKTNWGALKVIKKETGTNATLAGAKFELWSACTGGTKVLDEVTTGTNGEVTFPHVWLGNGTTTTKAFCLKETEPPVGHSIATEWTAVTLNADETGIVEQTIFNPPRETPALPLTGSTGTAIFMIGGLALIAAAGGAALMFSRRRTVTHE